MVSYGASPGRHAVLVDAGYLYASAGELVLGRSARPDLRVAAAPLIAALLARAAARAPGELLRMYWYDAARDRVPTVEQRRIAALPHVKVRLGNLDAAGRPKGVAAQLRADLELLARHRAVCDVILVTGDEDMLPAVEAAQAYGVRVHVWGVGPQPGASQVERLAWEADTVDQLDAGFCRPFLSAEAERSAAGGVSAGGVSAGAVPAGGIGAGGAVRSGTPGGGSGVRGSGVPGSVPVGSGPVGSGAVGAAAVPGAAAGAAGAAAVPGAVPVGSGAVGAAAVPGAGAGAVAAGSDGASGAAAPAGAPSAEEQSAADAGRALVPTPADVFRGRKPAPPPPVVTATTVASFGPGPSGYGLALSGPGPTHGHPPAAAAAERSGGHGPAADRPGPERPEMEEVGARIAARWLVTRGRDDVADLLPGPVLPTVVDKELLVEAEEEIGRSLRPYEEARRALRDGFWARLHADFGIANGAPPAAAGPPAAPAASAASAAPAAPAAPVASGAPRGPAASGGLAASGGPGAPAASGAPAAASAAEAPASTVAPAPAGPGDVTPGPAEPAPGTEPAAPGAAAPGPGTDPAAPGPAEPAPGTEPAAPAVPGPSSVAARPGSAAARA